MNKILDNFDFTGHTTTVPASVMEDYKRLATKFDRALTARNESW
jgi:hypothetical protein